MPRPGRRDNIVEAAVSLFSRKGYHGTTMRDIADESGMLAGSLYFHFPGKEELLYEIVQSSADQFMAAVEPIAGGDGSAAERLRQAMAAHLRMVCNNLDAATVFLHEWKALGAEHRAAVSARREDYEALFARIIREGIESGEFGPVDPKFARLLVLSAVNWVYEWYDPRGPLGPDEIARQFADLLMAGFARKERVHA